MPIYNKLVRDKIPQIIKNGGKVPRTRILDKDEYLGELNAKLREESEEYFRANNPQDALEELADMLEVIRALAVARGVSWEQLEDIRINKVEARGGFKERVYLIDVHDV
ncbi:nucleoside triphosphate pyrophosphohydrolase [Paenibacillus sp. 7124]|uniref:Nucleoside triphosphate pyrophosphohydrolase n=1 Tax=Paenibacillus apii TaxID=1850370 RepID=A0A6M1PQ57_9BACL|nr:nucleoside triphosphate pyrophosphohydrolase [Paenibacillus apii]NGM83863.1 nucleoside triphosphate pyrophosphohydrolase [Paenibacillus apii]NJJ40617.1 nucleoside triphosphate pyrophosphohydrolase [Paenibacillus apii]